MRWGLWLLMGKNWREPLLAEEPYPLFVPIVIDDEEWLYTRSPPAAWSHEGIKVELLYKDYNTGIEQKVAKGGRASCEPFLVGIT